MPDITTLLPLIQSSALFIGADERNDWIENILPHLTPAQVEEVQNILLREQELELAATQAEADRLQALLPQLHQLLAEAAQAVREQNESSEAENVDAKLQDLEKAIDAI